MPYFREYASSVDGRTTDNAELLRAHGCDGAHHVDEIDKVWSDGKGGVVYAELLGYQERGRCDGSCGTIDQGFFFYGPHYMVLGPPA